MTLINKREPLKKPESSVEPVQQSLCVNLVKELGGGHASSLGINLSDGNSEEVFKWFVASVLLSARINESAALSTYEQFKQDNILSPDAILQTSWQGLIDIMAKGGQGKYDSAIATRLLESSRTLKEKYNGDLNRLHFFAENGESLATNLRLLRGGIDQPTTDVFLRGLRDIWEKAQPPLAEAAILASRNLGLTQATDAEGTLEQVGIIRDIGWDNKMRLSDMEAALTKLGKDYCLRKRCHLCPAVQQCRLATGGNNPNCQ
ncbi:MAG: hypothetical protein ACLFPU_10250 [Dehalococcoidia bacterium]